MSRHFDWYPSEAHTKDAVVKAMAKKITESEREIAYYNIGLAKINELEEGKLCILTFEGKQSLVQCQKFRRDHVEFRVFASESLEIKLLANGNWSLSWNQGWETKPASESDAPIYVSCPYKTKYLNKLLKGKTYGTVRS